MDKIKFKYLVAFSILLWIPAGFASFHYFDSLPEELAAFAENQLESDLTIFDVILGAIALATFIANIGLFFLKNWARTIFTFGVIVTTAGMAFAGPTVQTAIETAIYEVAMVLDGLIIGLCYFSSVNKDFLANTHNKPLEEGLANSGFESN